MLNNKNRLGEDRFEKLNQLGFTWKHKQNKEELAWNSKFDMLKHYKHKEGKSVRNQFSSVT